MQHPESCSAYERLSKIGPSKRGHLFSHIVGHFDIFGEPIERAHHSDDLMQTEPKCIEYDNEGRLTYSNLRTDFVDATSRGTFYEGCVNCQFHHRGVCPIPNEMLNIKGQNKYEPGNSEAIGQIVGERLFTLLSDLNRNTGGLVFDIRDVAGILSCSTRTIYRLAQQSDCTQCLDGKIVIVDPSHKKKSSCELCSSDCAIRHAHIPRFDNRNIFPFPVTLDTAESCSFIWDIIRTKSTDHFKFSSLLLGHGYESHFERGLLDFLATKTGNNTLMSTAIGIDIMGYGGMLPFPSIQADMLEQISRFVYHGNLLGTFSLVTSVGVEFILDNATQDLLQNFFDNLHILMRKGGIIVINPWTSTLETQKAKLKLDDKFEIHLQVPKERKTDWQSFAVLRKK